MHHHLLVGNTNMAAFSLVYDTNLVLFSLVYDTNLAAVTSFKTLYGLVTISLDCMLVPLRSRKKYIENCLADLSTSFLFTFLCTESA